MRSQRLTLCVIAICLSGFGSCSHTVVELCQEAIPAYEKKLEDARLALGPVGPALPGSGPGAPAGTHGRALASVVGPGAGAGAPPQPPAYWTEWAEDRLKETQRFMDAAEDELLSLEVRKELSHLADQLVTFHGYSQQGNGARMASTLDRVLEQGKKVRSLACTPASPNLPNRSDR